MTEFLARRILCDNYKLLSLKIGEERKSHTSQGIHEEFMRGMGNDIKNYLSET